MSYFDTLSDCDLEALFAFMRQIDVEAQRLESEHRRLSPLHGQIPVGAAHFDPWVRYYAAITYVISLNRGNTPEAAAQIARSESRDAVRIHNSRRPKDHDWQRDLDTASTYIDRLLRRTTGGATLEREKT